MLSSSGVRDHLLGLGDKVAATMNATAPVASGALSHSHKATAEQHGDRVVVHVGSDLDYAAVIMVATGYAARALDSA